MTLRERLIALADANDDAMSGTDWAEHKMRYIVLAAAKLALEDAEGAVMDKWIQPTDIILCGDTIDSCANAIRALRDGL